MLEMLYLCIPVIPLHAVCRELAKRASKSVQLWPYAFVGLCSLFTRHDFRCVNPAEDEVHPLPVSFAFMYTSTLACMCMPGHIQVHTQKNVFGISKYWDTCPFVVKLFSMNGVGRESVWEVGT